MIPEVDLSEPARKKKKPSIKSKKFLDNDEEEDNENGHGQWTQPCRCDLHPSRTSERQKYSQVLNILKLHFFGGHPA